jgi:hypothetical protein
MVNIRSSLRRWPVFCLILLCSVALCVTAAFGAKFSIIAGCDNNVYHFGGGDVRNSSGDLLPVGCMLQWIYAGQNGTIEAPKGTDGTPGGDDVLISTEAVGWDTAYGFTNQNTPGLFFNWIEGTYSTGSPLIYVRAWDGNSFLTSTSYGNSMLMSPGTSPDVPPNPTRYGIISFATTSPKPNPDGPTGFIGTGESTTSIKWSWNGVANDFSYSVCDLGATVIGYTITGEVSTIEAGLTAGNYPYTRYVLAHLRSGQTTENSNQYTAFTLAISPDAKSARGGWKASGGFYVTTTWEAANRAGTLYCLHALDTADNPGTDLKIGTVEGLSANTIYTFEVRAINDNSVYSGYGERVWTVTPPAAPTLVASNITTREITWTWNTVPGADSYNLYVNGSSIYSGTGTIATTETASCLSCAGSVFGISGLYGSGAPGNRTAWTLPVVPYPFMGATALAARTVDLSWSPDNGNANAVYNVLVSATSSTDGYEVKVAGTSSKTAAVLCDQPSTLYWFRVVAVNGDGIESASSEALNIRSGSGGGENAPNIGKIKINDRSYMQGELINNAPVFTAIVSGDVNPTSATMVIDQGETNQITIPYSDISCEMINVNTWKIVARVRTPIPASPVSAHKVRITIASNTGGVALWEGSVSVMSGKVQVVGQVFNYPNPFRPMSSDPNLNKTTIAYNLNVDSNVTFIIYDITGREMYRRTFGSGSEGGRAGINQVVWNGRSIFNEVAGNGMYIYKIVSGSKVIGGGKLVVFDR